MQKFLQFKSISKRISLYFLFFSISIENFAAFLHCFSPSKFLLHTYVLNIITRTRKSPWSVANAARKGDDGISPGYGFSSAHPPSGETERRWHNSIRKFKAFPSFLGGDEGSVSIHKLKPIRLSLIYSWPSLVDRIYTRNIPCRSSFG